MYEHIDFDSTEWETRTPGLREKAVEVGPLQYRIVEFTSDFIESDWCIRGHIGYVIEGEFECAFPDHAIRLKKGDGLFITGGDETKHKATAITPTVQILLVDEADSA